MDHIDESQFVAHYHADRYWNDFRRLPGWVRYHRQELDVVKRHGRPDNFPNLRLKNTQLKLQLWTT